MLSIDSTSTTSTVGSGFNLGNIGSANNTSGEFTSAGYIDDIKEVSVSQFMTLSPKELQTCVRRMVPSKTE